MKLWINKRKLSKIFQSNIIIQNDAALNLKYCAPSDGINIEINKDNKLLARFDLNGKIYFENRKTAKFKSILKFNKIRGRINSTEGNIDLVLIESPASEIKLNTKLANWKKAIQNTIKYEIHFESEKIAEITHFAGINPKQQKDVEIIIKNEKWLLFVLVHCVNLLEDLKQPSGATA
jgi:hypothetical protein